MKKISKAKNANLIVAGATVLLGVILVLCPGSSIGLVCRVMGVGALILGAAKLIGYYSDDRYRLAFQFDLALGIFSLILGAVLILRPDKIISLAHIIIGVYILIEGVFKVQTAIDAKRFGMNKWWALMAGAAASVIAGLILVFFPFTAAKTVVRVIGAALILEGGESFFTTAYTVKAKSNKEDISAEYKDIT